MDATFARELRLVAGFAIQPFVAAAAAFLASPLLEYNAQLLHTGFQPGDRLEAAIAEAAGAGFLAFFVVFLAAPVVVWLLKRGPLSFKVSLGWGVVFGSLPIVMLMILSLLESGLPADGGALWAILAATVRALAIASLVGVACSSVFWIVAIRGTASAGHSTGPGQMA